MPALLLNLKSLRKAKSAEPRMLAEVTGIDPQRLRQLENRSAGCEPWLDEAYLLARALCTDGITPLMTASGDLTDCDIGFPLSSDINLWRSGVRLPLAEACRIALLFGLRDPYDLVVSPLHRQIWDVLARSERVGGPDICPWCLGTGGTHLATCLPNNLFGPRDTIDRASLGHFPRPVSGSAKRSATAIAYGLKDLRVSRFKTQAQMAAAAGMAANTYARAERCEINLSMRHAERFAATFGVEVATLFARGAP